MLCDKLVLNFMYASSFFTLKTVTHEVTATGVSLLMFMVPCIIVQII
jgi:hypothetical protein